MIYVALTLGLFGSMHCLTMCGPLVLGASKFASGHLLPHFLYSAVYNVGRIFSYIALGIIMGALGSVLNLGGIQKPMSIFLGVVLIILFLFSMDVEKLLFRFKLFQGSYLKFNKFLSNNLSRLASKNPFFLGMLNGLLPCGLVYLALAGALAAGGIAQGSVFMFFFGLGTFPALFVLMTGLPQLAKWRKIRFQKVLAFAQLALGILLIWRGFSVEIPMEFDLQQALRNPVYCH